MPHRKQKMKRTTNIILGISYIIAMALSNYNVAYSIMAFLAVFNGIFIAREVIVFLDSIKA